MTMTTFGERWAQAVLKKLQAYAKARGFKVSAPKVYDRQYQSAPTYLAVGVRDREGREVELAVAFMASPPRFLDDNGLYHDEVRASVFEELTAGLVRAVRPSPRQLLLDL